MCLLLHGGQQQINNYVTVPPASPGAQVPWNAVRRTWRNRRTLWRRSVKQADMIADLAQRLQEFRLALSTDDHSFQGCGHTWRQSVDVCAQGRGPPGLLLGLWEELRASISTWLDSRTKPISLASAHLQAGAARAMVAIQEAARRGSDSLAQVSVPTVVID